MDDDRDRNGDDEMDDLLDESRGTFTNPLHFLAERQLRRAARYLRDVGDLTREGSIEPRLWIGTVEALWSGLAEDYGDYLRLMTGWSDGPATAIVPPPAHDTYAPVQTIDVPERHRCLEAPIEVPLEIFAGADEIELKSPGLWLGRAHVLRPGTHISFKDCRVRTDRRQSEMHLHDLPDGLLAGMTLVGPVEAHLPGDVRKAGWPRLVTIVQVRVV